MKLSALLIERVRKILLLSLFAAIAGLIVYGVLWSTYTKERSKEFILSHLKQVIASEVSNQNTFNIDGELNRIVDTWSNTQEFPIRVDIYINGKHWAHGGPMQAFGIFSVQEKHLEKLASGENITLEIQVDLVGAILRLLTALAIFIGFLIAVYFSLKTGLKKVVREISKPLEDRVNALSEAAQDLSTHAKNGFLPQKSQVQELEKLDLSLATLFKKIKSLETEISIKKYSEGQFEMAKQVTHALNGSLGALSLYIDQATSTDVIDKEFLKGIVQQVKSISSDLTTVSNNDNKNSIAKQFDLVQAIKSVVNLKSQEITKISNKQIELTFVNNDIDNLKISGSKAKLELAIINLITNSVEAIEIAGKIEICVNANNDRAVVLVKDNGCGISESNLPKLMKEGATFGKENGSGNGLFHVKSIVDEFSGKMEISSQEKRGTQIIIEIPILKEQISKNTITLFEGQELIIVDDQRHIHQTWDLLLKDISDKLHVIHLYSDIDFENWLLKNNHSAFSSRLFIFDYNLGQTLSGLDLIEKYQLMFESYLITGMSNDSFVIKESKRLGVKAISKEELPTLKLNLLKKTKEKEAPDGSHSHRSFGFGS